MCGILVLFSSEKQHTSDKFADSLTRLSHRGPDGSGIFFRNERNMADLKDFPGPVGSTVFLGHRRLSIIDLSTGNQPMLDESGDYAIVFNGEIFNYRSLQQDLIKTYGVSFKSTSDTEVLMKGLLLEGETFLNKCNGMWAFAFYNLKENTMFLSRDRFGIKPLYYTTRNNCIVFSSEIKPLFNYNRAVENTEMLDFYRRTGLSDFSENTFFDGIYQVMPGHNMKLRGENGNLKIDINEWYSIQRMENKLSLSVKDVESHYRFLVEDSIRIRLESDVEIGALLSGGIDSSIVVDVASQQCNQPLMKTFSGISQNPNYDESYWINEVVKFNAKISNEKTNLEHDVTRDEIDNVILAMESPFSASSIISQNRLFKSIEPSGLKVILDGQGSDEINLGYDKYFGYAVRELFKQGKISKAIRYAKDLLTYQSKKHALLHYFNAFVPPVISDRFRKLMGYSSYKDINEMLFLSKNMDRFDFEKLLYQKMILPIHLRYIDRNSMQYSIEARSPFLDHRLVEYALNLPVDLRLAEGRRKGLLLNSMRQYLPDEIYYRTNKIGFKSDDKQILKDIGSDSASFKNYTIQRWQALFFEH